MFLTAGREFRGETLKPLCNQISNKGHAGYFLEHVSEDQPFFSGLEQTNSTAATKRVPESTPDKSSTRSWWR
ncbi:MAG: hypothetical protein ACJAVK_000066 [Akkermansiaceae bacterium]|jgi:hypothetical protein